MDVVDRLTVRCSVLGCAGTLNLGKNARVTLPIGCKGRDNAFPCEQPFPCASYAGGIRGFGERRFGGVERAGDSKSGPPLSPARIVPLWDR